MPYIQAQNEVRDDYKILKKSSPVVVVWRRRDTRGVLVLTLFAVVVPVLCYYLLFNNIHIEPATDTCSIRPGFKISCGYGNANFSYCRSISCCFDNSTKTCYHHVPSRYHYLSSDSVYKSALKTSPFKKPLLKNIGLTVQEINENVVRIILFDENNKPNPTTAIPNKNYNVSINESPLFVEIFRSNTSDMIFSTELGPLIASEKYWEWAFQLTDGYLFGLGQTLLSVKENTTLTKVVYANSNDHSTLPVFLAYKNKNYHGLIVRHDGPLEITILPSNLISLKSLAGGQIIVDVSVGPTIKEVMAQQNQDRTLSENLNMNLLGVHLCREGGTIDLKLIVKAFLEEKNRDDTFAIDYSSDCFHDNLVLGLTEPSLRNKTLEDVITSIKTYIVNETINFPISITPQVLFESKLYTDTAALDVFYKNGSGDYTGLFLTRDVAYPNFKHSSILKFLEQFFDTIKTSLGDIWNGNFVLSHNWPSDEKAQNVETKDFQYLSEPLIEALTSTIPWNLISEKNSHFLDHNLYGNNQLDQIQKMEPQSTIMTASHTFDTIQPLVIQNVDISWSNLQKSITTLLFNGIFGHPLTAIPVCGSTANFDPSKHETLCLRWYLMSATSPIFRISSDLPRRDPNSLTTISQYLGIQANRAIDLRKSLSYYFYTTLSSNEPLMRPMFYEFPHDINSFGLVNQYMVGTSLLVAHPTLPIQAVLGVYFPEGEAWFEYGGGDYYNYQSGDEGVVRFNVVESDWVAFVRGGTIVPIVEEENGGRLVVLKVGLKCDDNGCSATSDMNIENGVLRFTSDDQTLRIEIVNDDPDLYDFWLTEVQVFKEGEKGFYKLNEIVALTDIDSCSYDITSSSITCVKK